MPRSDALHLTERTYAWHQPVRSVGPKPSRWNRIACGEVVHNHQRTTGFEEPRGGPKKRFNIIGVGHGFDAKCNGTAIDDRMGLMEVRLLNPDSPRLDLRRQSRRWRAKGQALEHDVCIQPFSQMVKSCAHAAPKVNHSAHPPGMVFNRICNERVRNSEGGLNRFGPRWPQRNVNRRVGVVLAKTKELLGVPHVIARDTIHMMRGV